MTEPSRAIRRWGTVAVSVLLAAGAFSMIALSVGLGARAFTAWLDVSVFGLESPVEIDAADDVEAFPLAVGSLLAGVASPLLAALAVPDVRVRAARVARRVRERVRGRRCPRGHRLIDGERVCPVCDQPVE